MKARLVFGKVQLVRVEKTLTRTNSNCRFQRVRQPGLRNLRATMRTHYAPKSGSDKVPKWEFTIFSRSLLQSKSTYWYTDTDNIGLHLIFLWQTAVVQGRNELMFTIGSLVLNNL